MKNELTENDLIQLAKQLSCPEGQNGIKTADMMNEGNIEMTLSSIKALNIKDGDTVLELGHGNCGHLSKILNEANHIQYTGLEISETMKQQALLKNSEFISDSTVRFNIYNGEDIPYESNTFNKIMTVNTIYFWTNPLHLFNEIYRVLKPDGLLVLSFAQKEFMEKLPFTKYGFNLFDNQKLSELIQQTKFKKVEFIEKADVVKSKTGEIVNRLYTIAKLGKF
ncbi:class I SAM-dependent methyltransferase [Pseudopedobacter sp.]|uniref:class I SAM-dependent methyltransferase n=1 Tax=Pseudopedobacter sp. TaxID=1936787 RepID=UPI003341FA72